MFKNAAVLMLAISLLPGGLQAKVSTKTDNALQLSLKNYSLAVRWNDFEMASESLDPLLVKGERYSEQQEAYYKKFQISGYELKSSELTDAAHYNQRVELRIIDQDTQVERSKIDRQSWRYDPEAKRWWLTSGLPKLE